MCNESALVPQIHKGCLAVACNVGGIKSRRKAKARSKTPLVEKQILSRGNGAGDQFLGGGHVVLIPSTFTFAL